MKKTRKLKRVLSFGMAAVMAVGLTGVASAAGESASGVKIADQVVSSPNCVITDTEAKNVVIRSTYEGFNPIIVRDPTTPSTGPESTSTATAMALLPATFPAMARLLRPMARAT